MKTRLISHNLLTRGVAAAAIALSSVAVGAQSINVSTGFDASNTVIGSGAQPDAHWTKSIGGAAQTVYPNNADSFNGWLANDSNSVWIANDANLTDQGPTPYSFSTTFNLSNPAGASLSGGWAIDDTGTLSLNGNVISTLGGSVWGSLTSFSVPAGSAFFNPGVNTLTMTVTTTDRFLEGVRLRGTVNAPGTTPEPGSIALLTGVGLSGGLFLKRRKRAMR